MSKKVNLNYQIQNLLKTHLKFDYIGLKKNEVLLQETHKLLGDRFFKMIIYIKEKVEKDNIEYPANYFMGACKKSLENHKNNN